jgi:hypothetical protein
LSGVDKGGKNATALLALRCASWRSLLITRPQRWDGVEWGKDGELAGARY